MTISDYPKYVADVSCECSVKGEFRFRTKLEIDIHNEATKKMIIITMNPSKANKKILIIQ